MTIERRAPTHILVVEIPLHVAGEGDMDFDPVRDALDLVFAVSRAAFEGNICDNPQVTVREQTDDH